MDEVHLEEFKKHLKIYIGVFLALLVLTGITVGASYIHFGGKGNIVVALVIAALKAGLVAGWFMHLKSERRPIYRILYFTAFFFLALMFLTLWAFRDSVSIS